MPSDNDSINDEKNSNSYYILVDSDIFKGLLEELARCPACKSSNILFDNDNESRKGLSCLLTFSCNDCDWTNKMYTSKVVQNKNEVEKRGKKPFDANIRAIVAFREIGKG